LIALPVTSGSRRDAIWLIPSRKPQSRAHVGWQLREHCRVHLARECERIFDFGLRRLLRVTGIAKRPGENAEAIGSLANRFEVGVVLDAKAADRREIVRLAEG
jgi:hypothetical protein